jgi:Cysteine rich repeat
MKAFKILASTFFVFAVLATGLRAQQGPVSSACKDDIAKLCAGKEHGQGEVRACLEANKDNVTVACKTALATTGGGR